MFKLKKCKKIIASILSGLMLNTIIFSNIASSASEYTMSDVFTFTYTVRDSYSASFNTDNYLNVLNSLGTSELEVAYMYDDGLNGKKAVEYASMSSVHDDYITKVIFDEDFASVNWSRPFRYFTKLETVEFKYTGLDLTLSSIFRDNSSIKEVYIYASTMSVTDSAFRGLSSDAKIYVTSEDVKKAIEDGTSSGSYPISADQVIVMANEKQESEFTISCDNINYGTEGGLKRQTNIIAGDEEITYKLYSDEACENEYKGYSYSSALLPIGTYYIKGYMAATDNYKMSESNVVKVEVLRNFVNSKALASAIEEAEKLYNESNKDDYQAEAWNNVFSTTGTLQKAKSIYNDTEGLYNQSQVDTAAENLNTSLEVLKNSLADTTASRAALEEAIKKAEAILPGNYTDESYTKLTEAIANAKLLDQNALNSVLIAAKNNIDTAISGLTEKEKEPAGEPFAIINKNAVETTLGEFTADEAVAGATKIKITFDCADDVSFNQYASIEAKAAIAGVESYMKFAGTDSSQTAGAKGFTIELPLTYEIKSGDDVKLVAYTWAWANANDYVYAVTKVEYINAVGQVVKAVTDRTIALDELKAAIAEAEKIESDNYTEDSYAELTVLTAAKTLSDI